MGYCYLTFIVLSIFLLLSLIEERFVVDQYKGGSLFIPF